MTMEQHCLVVIDPQIDFCDPNGSLFVNHANIDSENLANFLNDHGHKISKIYVSLDSHPADHIADVSNWEERQEDGTYVTATPFSVVTPNDMTTKKFQMKDVTRRSYSEEYVNRVSDNKNGPPVTLWPRHCVVGSEGYEIYPVLAEALENFNDKVTSIHKGTDRNMEMYSAFSPLCGDLQNVEILDDLMKYSTVYVCGQALSHCVKCSVEDILRYEKAHNSSTNIVLITDGTSPIETVCTRKDCEVQLAAKGVILATFKDVSDNL